MVSKLLQQFLLNGERGPYLKLPPAQIGNEATNGCSGSRAWIRTTTSIHYFKTNFPDLKLKETTVKRLKCLYLSALQKQPLESRCHFTMQELILKKKDRPLTLGEEIGNKHVREYLLETWHHGGIINTAVAITTETRTVMSQNPSFLAADKKIELAKNWAKCLLNRMGFELSCL